MARYIDAEPMLREAIEERKFVFAREDARRNEIIVRTVYKDLAEFINNQPTADVVEVKHGEWLNSQFKGRCGFKEVRDYTCNLCKKEYSIEQPCNLMNYCPYCGAKMDGERKE